MSVAKQKQVKCGTCKHYVDKEDAQEVIIAWGTKETSVWRCPNCKEEWDKKVLGEMGLPDMKYKKWALVEETEEGASEKISPILLWVLWAIPVLLAFGLGLKLVVCQ